MLKRLLLMMGLTVQFVGAEELNENKVRSFVYQWFYYFDRQVSVDNYLKEIVDDRLEIRFPEITLNSHADFKNWYKDIQDKLVSNTHTIKKLNVNTVLNDRNNVDLVVRWEARFKDGSTVALDISQVWDLVEQDGIKLKTNLVKVLEQSQSDKPQLGDAQVEKVNSLHEVDAGMVYEPKKIPVIRPDELKGMRVAIVAAHGFEEIELTYPLEYFQKRGAQIDIITPNWIKDRVMAVQFLRPSLWIPVSKTISEANPADYDMVLIPGGAWNPIIMRTDSEILNFVNEIESQGSLVSAICHGPQVLINAGLVDRRDVTGVGDIRDDLRNAGAKVFDDKAVVVDGNLITSRNPNDLELFCKAIGRWLRFSKIKRRMNALD
jgi:protease I